MPIAGLTNTAPAFIKLGRIKKGDRGGKNSAPRDLDHFRLTFQPSPDAVELERAFYAAYGKEPKEINIRFASQNVSDVWDANYECYRKGGLVAKAGVGDNGPYWDFYRDPDTSEVLISGGMPRGEAGRALIEKPVDISAPVYYNANKEPQYLKPTGRLQAVIPELTRLGSKAVVGFFEFSPKSPRDIRNISGELGMYELFARAAGKTINGVPFKLIRRQEDVTKKIDGKLVLDKSWVCHITCEGEWGRLALERIEQMALPESVIDGEFEEWEEDTDEETTPPQLPAKSLQVPREAETGEVTDPLGVKQVQWAMGQLKKDEKATRHAISTHPNFKSPMPRSAFIAMVEGMAMK